MIFPSGQRDWCIWTAADPFNCYKERYIVKTCNELNAWQIKILYQPNLNWWGAWKLAPQRQICWGGGGGGDWRHPPPENILKSSRLRNGMFIIGYVLCSVWLAYIHANNGTTCIVCPFKSISKTTTRCGPKGCYSLRIILYYSSKLHVAVISNFSS